MPFHLKTISTIKFHFIELWTVLLVHYAERQYWMTFFPFGRPTQVRTTNWQIVGIPEFDVSQHRGGVSFTHDSLLSF